MGNISLVNKGKYIEINLHAEDNLIFSNILIFNKSLEEVKNEVEDTTSQLYNYIQYLFNNNGVHPGTEESI